MTDTTPPLPAALAAFEGTWRGKGSGHYPTIDPFEYVEVVELLQGPKPFLEYRSRTRDAGTGEPRHTECGYLRVAGETIELLLAQPTGYVEIHRGEVGAGAVDFTEIATDRSPDAKPVHSVHRRWAVEGDTLVYDLWMSHADTPTTHHLHAELHRETAPPAEGA
ncbi:FABP family protein [Rhodococcus sp. HNM0569]|uniref:FABP family protein n=1 Tax=Rhodococcus sp. HNM0569 TaxID=2716340 RepID=UPI00146F1F58|nr:FABP family protein [Rhodococcus sp. HNM0569]NLU82646.1 FABP family protein [Rhodococcus sp. HNM0569]